MITMPHYKFKGTGLALTPEARLDTRAAADFLGFSVKTLNQWRSAGRGPIYHKVGNRVFYHVKHLMAFLHEEARTSSVTR